MRRASRRCVRGGPRSRTTWSGRGLQARRALDGARARSAEIDERQIVGDLRQPRRARVALRGDQLLRWQRPLDAYLGIVVGDAAFRAVRVVAVLLVEHVGDVGED